MSSNIGPSQSLGGASNSLNGDWKAYAEWSFLRVACYQPDKKGSLPVILGDFNMPPQKKQVAL